MDVDIVRVSAKGQISIPVDMRKALSISDGDCLAAFATDDAQIQKAVQYIHRNYQKKISVKDVIAEVALSRRLLERRFKVVTGQTLYQYISDLKIKRFAELLLDTDEQVVGIALSLGENDTKSISRRFKQLYGCSPNEWREKNQKKK